MANHQKTLKKAKHNDGLTRTLVKSKLNLNSIIWFAIRKMSWLRTQMTQKTSQHYQQEDDLIHLSSCTSCGDNWLHLALIRNVFMFLQLRFGVLLYWIYFLLHWRHCSEIHLRINAFASLPWNKWEVWTSGSVWFLPLQCNCTQED